MSAISKEIRDPDYFAVEEMGDLYGFTFLVEQKEDILPLMQFIAGITFKK